MRAKLELDSDTVIDRLATAYRSGGAGTAGTPEYEKLCMDLIPTTAVECMDLMDVSVYGDPEHWPGLAAPAVDALGVHFQTLADGGDTEEEVTERAFRARTTTFIITREYESSPERYERLAPVLKGLAAILHHLPSHEQGMTAAWPMAEMLRIAPTQALAGPLQPLVQAFRERILSGKLSFGERPLLEQTIADQVRNGQIEEAFLPVADIL